MKVPDTFKCSDENLPNSSCHFPNHQSVFLQILHDSSVSWNITPLYFFRSNVIYFAQKGSFRCKFFRLFSAWIKIHPIFVIFETKSCFFFRFCTTIQYFLSWNFIYFRQKEPINIQIWWNFTWAVESLKFCTLAEKTIKLKIK